MTKAGRNVFVGINAQAWAAMSLFLQYVGRHDFQCIRFEGPRLEDFDLVFDDGHRTICESKASRLSYAGVRDILSTVIGHAQIKANDEILIICEGIHRSIRREIELYEFFERVLNPKLEKKGFREEHLNLFPQVRFWEVTREVSVETVELLAAELLGIWVPDHSLREITANLVVKKVYFGSEEGAVLSKQEFLQELGERKRQILDDSGYRDSRESKERDIEDIIEALADPTRKEWANNRLSVLTSEPDLHYFALKRLEKKTDINLREWDRLWNASARGYLGGQVFKIFRKNLRDSENQRYVLEFALRMARRFVGFYARNFLAVHIVEECDQIADVSRDHDDMLFRVVRKLFSPGLKDTFYLKHREDTSWERGRIAGLLKTLYDRTPNDGLRTEIIDYIARTFNLIADEGKYWHYTPPAIFEILREHVTRDVTRMVSVLTRILVRHYSEFYRRYGSKLRFEGWEHSGGGVSISGPDFSIGDRHFVTRVLKPVLDEYHRCNREEAWKFIVTQCVTVRQSRVSRERPDFLNRAVIEIVLDEYAKTKHSREAYEILTNFIRMKKGIPHKSDLIFSAVRASKVPAAKKWELVRVSLGAYDDLPVNVFVEQTTLDLAKRGVKDATRMLRGWVKRPEYCERTGVFEGNIAQAIGELLESSPEDGIGMFSDFIAGEYFVRKMDSFDAFSVARVLRRILHLDFELGLGILTGLSQKAKPSENEQILMCSSLVASDWKKQDERTLMRTYVTFLDRFLDDLGNDIREVEARITRPPSREELVQFAGALAEHEAISEALRIVELFVGDSDPCAPRTGSSGDRVSSSENEHVRIERGEEIQEITTVRGWCAWVLAKCVVLRGRSQISRIMDLTEKLAQDPNYYVRHMACFPLSQLARNRLAFQPSRRDVLFLNDDRKTALQMSKRVEQISFSLLRDISESPRNVQRVLGKSILRVFMHLRALNQKDALRFTEMILRFPDELVGEAAPLFIYLAEFRVNLYRDWKWKVPGLYDDLDDFNQGLFQDLVCKVLRRGNRHINSHFASHLRELVDTSLPGEARVRGVLGFEQAFAVAQKYLLTISDYPDRRVFENLYGLIAKHLEKKPQECYQLWRKCLREEKRRIEEERKISGRIDPKEVPEAYWWPHEVGEILMKIEKHLGNEEFLDSFESLLKYPKESRTGDIQGAVALLMDLPSEYNKRTKELIGRLIQKDAVYYAVLERWRKKTEGE